MNGRQGERAQATWRVALWRSASSHIVLLDANPLEDIKNTQAIWRVIKGGRMFDPEVLQPSGN